MANEKNRYKAIVTTITEIVNRLDPVGLLGDGAPKDEYSEEIRLIASYIQDYTNVTKLGELIYSIFLESFDKEIVGKKDDYLKVAEEIIEELKKNGLLRD